MLFNLFPRKPKNTTGWRVYEITMRLVVKSQNPPTELFEQGFAAGMKTRINNDMLMDCLDINVQLVELEK